MVFTTCFVPTFIRRHLAGQTLWQLDVRSSILSEQWAKLLNIEPPPSTPFLYLIVAVGVIMASSSQQADFAPFAIVNGLLD